MTGTRVILPSPHPGQREVLSNPARFKWLSCGRRWRKTTLALHPAVLSAINGATILWGAPTADQTGVGWEECKHSIGEIAQIRESFPHHAEFPSGGRIVFETLDDPNNGRGFTWDGVVFDEVAFIKPAAYYEIVQPILSDTGGWFLGIGTPNYRNWFYNEWIKAKERSDSAAYQIPTLGVKIENGTLVRHSHPLENPDFSFNEATRLYNSVPLHVFRQEFLAEFIEGEGIVFRNVRACCILKEPDKPENHQGHTLLAGLDWGKVNDFTRIRIGCKQCKRIVDWDGFNQIDYVFQRGRLGIIYARWHPANFVAESNSIGIPNIEMLTRDGIPVVGFDTTASSKPPLIENLALELERGEWKFPEEDADELESYEVKINPVTGRPSYSAPEGGHDDRVMADALMLQAGNMWWMS